jgi:hypothetical protein
LVPPEAGLFFTLLKGIIMFEKKPFVFKSPDLNKLQAVIIDYRTTIYVAIGADAEEAKQRYLTRIANKKP